MSNFSTATRYLSSASPNPGLIDLNVGPPSGGAFQSKDNAEFLAAVATRLKGSAKLAAKPAVSKGKSTAKVSAKGAAAGEVSIASNGVLAIGLVGEYGQLGYALRRSQEVIRFDKSPSYWSSAFLFLDPISTDPSVNRDPKRSPRILEATLQPGRSVASLFAFRNGLTLRRFSDHAAASFDLQSAPSTPNIAVLCLGLTDAERTAVTERALRPESEPLSYDLPQLLAAWFDFALNLGKRHNPLLDGLATPSVSFLQLAFDAAGIDLCAGASDRNMAPEHLWQSARFLHSMFETRKPDGSSQPRPFTGFHCVREKSCLLAPADVELPRSFEEFVSTHRLVV